jgi:hypothetical protein
VLALAWSIGLKQPASWVILLAAVLAAPAIDTLRHLRYHRPDPQPLTSRLMQQFSVLAKQNRRLLP